MLDDALRAAGGRDLWRLTRRFTAHLSIGGALQTERFGATPFKELVAVGGTHAQILEITGLPRANVRGLYWRDGVALESSDERRIAERRAAPEEFRRKLLLDTWDELTLTHFYGYLIWNYIASPLILSDPDFEMRTLRRSTADPQSYRRLEVVFPERIVTHAPTQVFHFDRRGLLMRIDYPGVHRAASQVVQVFSGHQRFGGVLIPTLCSLLSLGDTGVPTRKPSLLDLEIFDVKFE